MNISYYDVKTVPQLAHTPFLESFLSGASIFYSYYGRCVCKTPANDDPKILLSLFKRESIHKKSILPSLFFALGLYNCKTFLCCCRTEDCTL